MTLYEFNALDLTEKAEAVWRGTFLADREADGLTIQLYSLTGFYVELFYDPLANKITDFHAFTNKQLLAPYLAQSKFPL
jgi:hypothetical protein